MCPSRLLVLFLVLLLLTPSVFPLAPLPRQEGPSRDHLGDALPAGAVTRAGTARWRHDGTLTFLAFLPDGKTVVSAGTDRKIRFWEAANGRELRQIDMESGGTDARTRRGTFTSPATALSPDGRILAWSLGGPVTLWDVDGNKELTQTKGAILQVVALAFASDGKTLAGLEADGTVRLWDSKCNQVRTWRVSRGGARMEGPEAGPGRGGGGRGPGGGGRGPGTSRGPGGSSPGVSTLAFTPDGKTLLISTTDSLGFSGASGFGGRGGGPRLISNSGLWEVETGKLARSIRSDGAGSSLSAPVLSPDGRTVACISRDGFSGDSAICVMETASGKELKKWTTGGLSALLFSPNGKKLLGWSATGARVTVWDLDTGKEDRRVELGLLSSASASAERTSGGADLSPGGRSFGGGMRARVRLALSPDGKRLIFPRVAKVVGVVDLTATPSRQPPLAGHDGPVMALGFSADSKTLLTWDMGQNCRLWNASTGRAAGTIPLSRTSAVVFSPDGKSLASFSSVTLRMLDVSTGKDRGQLRGQLGPLDSFRVAFSADGSRLAVLNPKDVQVLDTDTLKEIRSLRRASATVPDFWTDVERSWEPGPFLSPDGRYVAAPMLDRRLVVWDVDTGMLLWETPLPTEGRFRGGVFTADGRTVVLDMEDFLLLRERATGKERRRLNRPGAAGSGYGSLSSSFSPLLIAGRDGRVLAQIGKQDQILVWDLYSGGVVELTGHRGRVRSLAFSPDGQRLASGSDDTTALVWDARALADRLRKTGPELTAQEGESVWSDLGSGDAGRAFAVLCRLIANPEQAVSLLENQLQPVASASEAQIERWLGELDHRRFAVRQKARAELEKLGGVAVPALKKVVKSGASTEVRKVAEEMLRLPATPDGSVENLRTIRAIEVLEQLRTASARDFLRKLAAGSPGAVVTIEARSALARLAPRK